MPDTKRRILRRIAIAVLCTVSVALMLLCIIWLTLPSAKTIVASNPVTTAFIDRYEKRLYEAIDGQRSIAQIVARTEALPDEPQRPVRARAFFERLWWYDQVVFDASRNTTAAVTHE